MRIGCIGIGFLFLGVPSISGEDAHFVQRRAAMVKDQIESRGVVNPEVLAAMNKVPRHLFVPKNVRESAYEDRPLPIGYGQTISQPYIVAAMTELVEPKKTDRVLEIGTGSGYQAAILAEIVNHVYTIEIVKGLAEEAGKRLKDMGYSNVTVKAGDGFFGWKDEAPFDAIVVTAAPESVPPPLLDQLKPGGLMVIPVGSQVLWQHLKLIRKNKDGSVSEKNVMPVRFVPFTGQSGQ